MRLIEPDEHKKFLATLERIGLARDDFSLQETDTTDPKGDENFGLRAMSSLPDYRRGWRRNTQSASKAIG